jgi:uncharacterized protein YukE
MTDASTQALVDQHATLARGRFRWPWQPDPEPFLNDIAGLVEQICFGDMTAADNVSADLVQAHRRLTARLDEGFDGATRNLIDWTGSAADAFSTYLNQVHEAIEQYDDILHDFMQIQAGYAALVRGCVKDTQALLNKAIEAQQEEAAKDGWNVALTAIAAVAGVVSTVLSGGGALAGWAIVTSAVGGVAATTDVLINTGGPGETAQSLADGLTGLLSDVNDQLSRFDKAIIELRQYLDNGTPLPAINPAMPPFVTANRFDPNSFHVKDEPPGIEDGVSRDPLVKPGSADPNSTIGTRLAGTG